MAPSPRNIDFSFLEEISDQSIEDIVSAVRDGANSYAQAMGFSPEALAHGLKSPGPKPMALAHRL